MKQVLIFAGAYAGVVALYVALVYLRAWLKRERCPYRGCNGRVVRGPTTMNDARSLEPDRVYVSCQCGWGHTWWADATDGEKALHNMEVIGGTETE